MAMVSELVHACRSLRHHAAYFLTCAGTLALVLGANTAIFTVVNATIVRPMPFATRGDVVHLFANPPGTTAVLQRNPLQQMEVPRIRDRARSLARLEGFFLQERVVTLGGEPTAARAAAVTPGLLTMLAAPIARGRAFTPAEGEPGHFVAIVSDAYWRNSLGSANVLGTSIVVDGQPHTIVGVLSPAFAVPFVDAQLFTPLVANPDPKPRQPALTVVGLAELAPGATLAQARDELTGIYRELARDFPKSHAAWTIGVETAREWQYGALRAPLLMLLAATGLVLLIACANVANLTSAETAARAGELSLRIALGASVRDVVRLHVAELLVISAAGLVPGLLLAGAAVRALLAINPTVAQTIGTATVDWRVQTFSAIVALFTALATAAVPALRAVRRPAAPGLGAAPARTTGSPREVRVQRALVSAEVALCVALLLAGGVVIQGLRDLTRRSPGYDATGVLTAQIRLPQASYGSPVLRAVVVKRLLDGFRALPGVVAVGMTQNAFIPNFSYQTLLSVKDRPTANDQPLTVQYRRVSAGYFAAMRITVMAGRVFSDDDTADRPPVAVISRRFAASLMPGLDPVGRVLMRSGQPPVTIVGVVDDASDVTVTAPAEPTFYLPWSQNNNFDVPIAFVIRAAVDPSSLVPAVRDTLKRVDASLPLRKPQPLETFVNESLAPDRFRAIVLTMLAALGLVLAGVGIAGMTYRSVVGRTREFAVRLALGSRAPALVGLVVRATALDMAIGACAGLLGGVWLCALVARSLDNVGALDAATTVVAVAALAVVGVTASIVPARRIAGVDPADALRG